MSSIGLPSGRTRVPRFRTRCASVSLIPTTSNSMPTLVCQPFAAISADGDRGSTFRAGDQQHDHPPFFAYLR